MTCRKSSPSVENIVSDMAGGSTLQEISVDGLKIGDTLASSIRCSFSYKIVAAKGYVYHRRTFESFA